MYNDWRRPLAGGPDSHSVLNHSSSNLTNVGIPPGCFPFCMSSICGTENAPGANSISPYYTTHDSLTTHSQLQQECKIKLRLLPHQRRGEKLVKMLEARVKFHNDYEINPDTDFFYLVHIPESPENNTTPFQVMPERDVQRSLSGSSQLAMSQPLALHSVRLAQHNGSMTFAAAQSSHSSSQRPLQPAHQEGGSFTFHPGQGSQPLLGADSRIPLSPLLSPSETLRVGTETSQENRHDLQATPLEPQGQLRRLEHPLIPAALNESTPSDSSPMFAPSQLSSARLPKTYGELLKHLTVKVELDRNNPRPNEGYGYLDLSKVKDAGLKYRICFFCPKSRFTGGSASHLSAQSARDPIKFLGKSSSFFIIEKAATQSPSRQHSMVDASELAQPAGGEPLQSMQPMQPPQHYQQQSRVSYTRVQPTRAPQSSSALAQACHKPPMATPPPQSCTTLESVVNVQLHQPTEQDDRESFETDKVIKENLNRDPHAAASATFGLSNLLVSLNSTSQRDTATFVPDSLGGARGASDDTLSNLQEGVEKVFSMTYEQAVVQQMQAGVPPSLGSSPADETLDTPNIYNTHASQHSQPTVSLERFDAPTTSGQILIMPCADARAKEKFDQRVTRLESTPPSSQTKRQSNGAAIRCEKQGSFPESVSGTSSVSGVISAKQYSGSPGGKEKAVNSFDAAQDKVIKTNRFQLLEGTGASAVPCETESNRASLDPILHRPSTGSPNHIIVQNQEVDKENADPRESQPVDPLNGVDLRQLQNFGVLVDDVEIDNHSIQIFRHPDSVNDSFHSQENRQPHHGPSHNPPFRQSPEMQRKHKRAIMPIYGDSSVPNLYDYTRLQEAEGTTCEEQPPCSDLASFAAQNNPHLNFDSQSRNAAEGASSITQQRNQYSDRKQLSTVEEENSMCSDITSLNHKNIHNSSRSRKSIRSPGQTAIMYPRMFGGDDGHSDASAVGNLPLRIPLSSVTFHSHANGPLDTLKPTEVSTEEQNKSSRHKKQSLTEEDFRLDSEDQTGSNQKSWNCGTYPTFRDNNSGHSTKTCSKQPSAVALNPQSIPVSPEAPQPCSFKDTVVQPGIENLWATQNDQGARTLQVPQKEAHEDHHSEQSSGSLRSFKEQDVKPLSPASVECEANANSSKMTEELKTTLQFGSQSRDSTFRGSEPGSVSIFRTRKQKISSHENTADAHLGQDAHSNSSQSMSRIEDELVCYEKLAQSDQKLEDSPLKLLDQMSYVEASGHPQTTKNSNLNPEAVTPLAPAAFQKRKKPQGPKQPLKKKTVIKASVPLSSARGSERASTASAKTQSDMPQKLTIASVVKTTRSIQKPRELKAPNQHVQVSHYTPLLDKSKSAQQFSLNLPPGSKSKPLKTPQILPLKQPVVKQSPGVSLSSASPYILKTQGAVLSSGPLSQRSPITAQVLSMDPSKPVPPEPTLLKQKSSLRKTKQRNLFSNPFKLDQRGGIAPTGKTSAIPSGTHPKSSLCALLKGSGASLKGTATVVGKRVSQLGKQ